MDSILSKFRLSFTLLMILKVQKQIVTLTFTIFNDTNMVGSFTSWNVTSLKENIRLILVILMNLYNFLQVFTTTDVVYTKFLSRQINHILFKRITY